MPPKLHCLASLSIPLELKYGPSFIRNKGQIWSRARARALSTRPSLSEWIKSRSSSPSTTHHDTLDPLRASHLLRTLPTRQHLPNSQLSAREGDELCKGSHMIYFQPETALRDLGPDGSSPEYNAPHPYTRRMWAGGSFTWPTPGDEDYKKRMLRIGRKVIERRSIDKIEYKEKGDMVFYHQKREIWDSDLEGREGMWGVKEIRTHVFRPPSAALATSTALANTSTSTSTDTNKDTTMTKEKKEKASPLWRTTQPDISFTYTPTTPLLFRYSALTFNAHKIHYDHLHSINTEGQPAPLVHGPLTATLLVELADRAAREKDMSVIQFDYRAVGPIVVDREVEMFGWSEGGKLEMVARQDGRVGMKASALFA